MIDIINCREMPTTRKLALKGKNDFEYYIPLTKKVPVGGCGKSHVLAWELPVKPGMADEQSVNAVNELSNQLIK